MALKGEDSGDTRGPGNMRDMDFRDRVEGRSDLWGDRSRRDWLRVGGIPDR